MPVKQASIALPKRCTGQKTFCASATGQNPNNPNLGGSNNHINCWDITLHLCNVCFITFLDVALRSAIEYLLKPLLAVSLLGFPFFSVSEFLIKQTYVGIALGFV